MDNRARALEMYKAIQARKEKERKAAIAKEKLADQYCGKHYRGVRK